MNNPNDKPNETPQLGGCQCGAVRYEVSGEPQALYACHCLECQKQSASAFGLSLTVQRVDFRLTHGAVKLWSRTADSGRTVRCLFCADCGTRLWHEFHPESETLRIRAGSLDNPTDIRPAIHIWTSRKLPGVVVPDGAAQFPKGPE
jgi:hypothetical protein